MSVDRINAEKIALDQSYVEALRASMAVKTELVLANNENQKVKAELEALKKEFNEFKAKHEPVTEVQANAA